MAGGYLTAGWKSDPFQADCVRYWDGSSWKGRAVTFPEFEAAPKILGIPLWALFEKAFNDETAGWHDGEGDTEMHWVAGGQYTGLVGSPRFLYREIYGLLERYGLAEPGASRLEDPAIIGEKLVNLSREARWAISDLCRFARIDFEAKKQTQTQVPTANVEILPPYVLAHNAPDSPTPVSDQEIPGDATEAGWRIEYDDPSEVIFWNTERWSKRISLKDFVLCQFYVLGEEPPANWNLAASSQERDVELVRQLSSRSAGNAGWYIDPHSNLMDRNVRYWDGQWTEHTAADGPGWYDDPDQKGNIQFWDGAQWTGHKQNKLALQASVELAEQQAERKRQRNIGFAMRAVDVGVGLAVRRKDQNRTRQMAERRRSDQWERDRQASIRTEAARQQEKFYRDANNRRR